MTDWTSRLWHVLGQDPERPHLRKPFTVITTEGRFAVGTNGHAIVGLACTDADAPTGNDWPGSGDMLTSVRAFLLTRPPCVAHVKLRDLRAWAGLECSQEPCINCDGVKRKFSCLECEAEQTCQLCSGSGVDIRESDFALFVPGKAVNRKLVASVLACVPPDDADVVVVEVRWYPEVETAPVKFFAEGWRACVMPGRVPMPPEAKPFLMAEAG